MLKSTLQREETAPLLPRRPQQTSQPSQSSFTPTSTANASASVSAPNLTDDWWNGSTNSVGAIAQQQPQPQATGMPQIYQYTDPVTGQISYIDSNGQEYLDPNNPQHQQQLMQMNNPQLIAQQTNKQNIMSLYNQPTGQQQMQQQPLQQQQMQTFFAAAAATTTTTTTIYQRRIRSTTTTTVYRIQSTSWIWATATRRLLETTINLVYIHIL